MTAPQTSREAEEAQSNRELFGFLLLALVAAAMILVALIAGGGAGE